MCLIITGAAHKIKNTLLNTDGLLLDIFKTNPDGIGIMYATKERLKIFKKLPKSLEQAQRFVERMPSDERSMAVHFRWTTHGDTDLENCHPYTVVEGEVALMHNGVLSVGNQADRTKSDTWHFIKDYLRNVVTMAPAMVFDPGFAAMVREFIGTNNRFVFMDKYGKMIILNKSAGLEHDDLWFSNSYAWTPKLLIDDYKGWGTGNYNRGRHYGGYGEYGDDDLMGGYSGVGRYTWPNGGGQSSGPKSGVTHNRPQLPAGETVRGAANTPSVSPPAIHTPTYTQADAKAEEEWETAVRRSHQEWQRDSRAVLPGEFAIRRAAVNETDPPEEGAQVPQRHGIVEIGAPTRSDLIHHLTDGTVDVFDVWLSEYAQVTLGILFHLYKATPTKWVNVRDLKPKEAELYNACIAGDKTLLIEEARRNDGTAAVLAEIICYHLNWLAWTSPTVETPDSLIRGEFPYPKAKQVLNEPQPVLPEDQQERILDAEEDSVFDTKAAAHLDASEAQMGQGGEGNDHEDGYGYISLM